MSIIADRLEEYRKAHHPLCPPVFAYLTADGKNWWIECPYCGLHHKHGASDADPESAGLRSPHCPPGVHKPHDYFLIPDGHIADVTIAQWGKFDRKRLPKLMLQMERTRAEERAQRELRREQAWRGEIPPWHVD